MELLNGDCLELLKDIPDDSIDLVLTDPPYNIGKAEWDKIDKYIDFSMGWIKECHRVLKPNGVFYFWHNDIMQIAELLNAINDETGFEFRSFCIWDKGDAYRAQTWKNRKADGNTSPRLWFNVCEYCLHFFNTPQDSGRLWKHTGAYRINSNPQCYRPLKEWYAKEMERLGITVRDIAAKYTEATGKEPYMLRHYFRDSQFEIPTRAVWESVYMPLGFDKSYEDLRNTHNVDPMHCNIWHVPYVPAGTKGRYHPCDKPVQILERLIKVSSKEGATVLDCFMGTGSTGEACINTGRDFIGIEKDRHYYDVAKSRIREAGARVKLTV